MTDQPSYKELEKRVRELENAERERRRMEAALQESEALLAKSQEIAHVGSWVYDAAAGRLVWSDETFRILGLEPQECTPSDSVFLDMVHPDDRERVASAYADSLENGRSGLDMEHRVVRPKTGEIRYIEVKWTHERGPGGEVLRSIGILQDTTERKRSEEAILEREERYRFLAENMGDIIWTLDLDLNATYVSPSVEKVLGFPPEERMQQRLSDMIPPSSLEKLLAVYAEELRREEGGTADPDRSITIELEHYHRDGSLLWFENKVKAQRDEGGKIKGIYGVSRDISQRKAEEATLRTMAEMLDTAPSSITVHDTSGRFLYANQKTFELHGCTRESFLSMNLRDVDVPESEALINERMRRILEEKEARFEVSHYRMDGSTFPMEVLAKTIEWDGQPAILSIADDISERKQAEASMQAVLEQQEAILDSSMVGIMLLHNRVVTKVNRRMAEMLGYRPEEIEGRDPEPLHLSRGHFIEFGEHYYWRLAEKNIVQVEYPLRHRSGDTVWCLFSGRAVSPPDLGRGAVWAIDDITARRRAEEALRESEQRYRNLFENAPVGVFRTHSSGSIVLVNQTMARMLGFDSAQALAAHYQDLGREFFVQPERRSDLLARLRRDGYVENFEYAGRTPRGRIIWLSLNARRIDEDTGESFFIEGFATDITQRRRAEEEKARLEEQFHQAQKMESIGRLAGGVAHDLNNLLSPILGYGEMLLEDASAYDPRREPVVEIVNAGRRAQALVRQLLAFSRKQPLQFQPLDINALLKDFKKLLRRTMREDIEIEMKLGPSIPRIRGDLGQIEQVIMNLAINAQDAMPQGGRLVIKTAGVELDESYAKQKRGVKPGRYALMAISDTGAGMDAGTLAHLFEPFFTTKEKGKGTGLGMSTAYGIVKQHGGNIWAYSEPGMGTTIKVYLPLVQDATEAPPPAEQKAPEARGEETVLLVEDDRPVRNLASAVLQRCGYAVLAAENGEEALSVLSEHEGAVHLLLADVIMPDMNGRELFEAISDGLPHLRVLYMSGYTDDVIAHHGVIDPGVNFIEKPFTIKALAAKVREVLDQ